MPEEEIMDEHILVGYVRKSNNGIKISINVRSFNDCEIYTTSDGQEYVSLIVNTASLSKIITGERSVTTISQIIKNEVKDNE